MRWREFPVLDEADEPLVDEFGMGLDRDAARVLAYLVRREASPESAEGAASRLAIRVGTDLGRDAARTALSSLGDRGLVETTQLRGRGDGRPPTGWRLETDSDALADRVYATHAVALLERSREVAALLDTDLAVGDFDAADALVRPAGATADLRVALNWRPNGLHAPFLAAEAFDVYGDYGVDISFSPSKGSHDALEAVRSGDAELALSGAATVCRVAAEEFVPVALPYQRSMAVLYATTEAFGGPLESVDQLCGERIAMTPATETGTLARLLLSQAGVLDDVEVVDTGTEEREVLAAGGATVAVGVPSDVRELSAAGYDVSSLPVAEHFPVPGLALVTTRRFLEERPSATARLLAGTMAGVVAARRAPDAAAEAVAARSHAPAADERRQFEAADERFATGDAVEKRGWGWQPVDAWERLRLALRQVALPKP